MTATDLFWTIHAVERLWERARLAPDEVEEGLRRRVREPGVLKGDLMEARHRGMTFVLRWTGEAWMVKTVVVGSPPRRADRVDRALLQTIA